MRRQRPPAEQPVGGGHGCGVGLLERQELAACRRVEELREKAGRIPAEPAAAEHDRQEWAIARRRVDVVPASDGDGALLTRGVSSICR
ncbi:hypothetical protein ACIBJC_29230 [Streptomyces sp. NPDC050509]|uniref:hypothetical protein n=1 Tax=Streptomyces sp. NPDC050509 TaxID=3365620 RepID=UPI003788153E